MTYFVNILTYNNFVIKNIIRFKSFENSIFAKRIKMNVAEFYNVFEKSIQDYHVLNTLEQKCVNPFATDSFESILYHKNWIDTVQWHCEDEIRNPNIALEDAILFKRKIDALNQERTDKVEQIDDFFIAKYSNVTPLENATWNTESPAWAIDRLSILALKIYHMYEELQRIDASKDYISQIQSKLDVLLLQKSDLIISINELLSDIAHGKKIMKVYRQMKMYNDLEMNPILRKNKMM